MASTAKDLAKRLGAAAAAAVALSDAELAEERQADAEGEEAHVLRLTLSRALALLHACAAPAQEPATLEPLQTLLTVSAVPAPGNSALSGLILKVPALVSD